MEIEFRWLTTRIPEGPSSIPVGNQPQSYYLTLQVRRSFLVPIFTDDSETWEWTDWEPISVVGK